MFNMTKRGGGGGASHRTPPYRELPLISTKTIRTSLFLSGASRHSAESVLSPFCQKSAILEAVTIPQIRHSEALLNRTLHFYPQKVAVSVKIKCHTFACKQRRLTSFKGVWGGHWSIQNIFTLKNYRWGHILRGSWAALFKVEVPCASTTSLPAWKCDRWELAPILTARKHLKHFIGLFLAGMLTY